MFPSQISLRCRRAGTFSILTVLAAKLTQMISEKIDLMGLESGSNETAICSYMKGVKYGTNLPTEHTALTKTIGEHFFVRNNNLLLPGNDDDEPSAPADSSSGPLGNLAIDEEESTGLFDAASFFLDVDDDVLFTPPLAFDTDADGVPAPALEDAAHNISVPAPAPLIIAHFSTVPVKRGKQTAPEAQGARRSGLHWCVHDSSSRSH